MNYRVSIAKGDTKFEAEGDKKFVVQMLARYSGIEPASQDAGVLSSKQRASRSSKDVPPVAGKKTSVGEFIRQLEVKKHMDLVVAFGYYLEKNAGLGSFTVADINNCYYEAKLESSNTSQMIIQNIKKGLLMAAKGEGDKRRQAFVLTRTGEEYVANFNSKASK